MTKLFLSCLFCFALSLVSGYGSENDAPPAEQEHKPVDEASSILDHTRLLELAWDRRDFAGIINCGKDLLSAFRAQGVPENYDAIRYIAMALFDNLPAQPYDPSAHQLPQPPFPDTMDGLLEKLNSQRPEDIEIAKRYAEFIVSVGRDVRANFTVSASEQLRGRSEPDRLAMARERIDVMIQHNSDDPAAYLARYQFIMQFVPPSEALEIAYPDLQRVLELSPSSKEGLILSALHALRLSGIAAQGGEPERAALWQEEAEKHFRHTVRENPSDPLGYHYLGEYLLSVKRAPEEAIKVWSDGLRLADHRNGSEELVGRLTMALLEQGKVEEARTRLDDFSRTIDEMPVTHPKDVQRTRDMQDLLTARLYSTEANRVEANIEAAIRENRPGDVQLLYGVVQQRRSDAVQRFEKVLLDFGKNEEDYIIDRRSVYFTLLSHSLLQLAQLKWDMQEPDKAAEYFQRATRFPEVLRQALIGQSIAYQQMNQLDRAAQTLREAATRFPDDMSIRYTHAMVSFRSQTASNTATPETLGEVRRDLEALKRFQNELPQPWILDVRLIHLDIASANLTNQADTIKAAMSDALRRYRTLEGGSFPPDAEGNVKNYIDDQAFVTELVGVYSSLAARADFDRLLERLRAFPDGEDAYFDARINDACRRDNKNEVIEIIDEAIESPRLSQAKKNQFVALLHNLRGEGDGTSYLELAYKHLRTTFDESPETLRPQAFFMLAEMSLDRGGMEQAQQIKERLEKIEGPIGTHWRYIQVRQMLAEDDPDYDAMRRIQEEIARFRPEWDKTHLLSAMIEERYLALNPGDTVILEKLIAAYRSAIRCGNMQPEVWNHLIEYLELAGRTEETRVVLHDAALRGITLESARGQLPQPYGRMYSQIQEAIAKEDAIEADTIARQATQLAEVRGEKPELILTLHLTLGQVFLNASMFESAYRHLSETGKRGGRYIYPLALCMAKSGDVDSGFTLLLDEIDRTPPSAMPLLLPAVLVLLAQAQPSEENYNRIDSLMERVEREKPVNPEVITTLTDYWIVRGKPERAIPLYEESLARGDLDDTRVFVFQNNLAMLYSQLLGQHQKALEVVDKALATQRDNITLLDTKGLILINAGNPAEAIPVLQRVVELSDQLPVYCMHLAYALNLEGRDAESRRYFDAIRDQLTPLVPNMTKENKAMYDALTVSFR